MSLKRWQSLRIMRAVFQVFVLLFALGLEGYAQDTVWVDDFDDHAINALPEDWKGRKKKAREFYHVVHDPEVKDNHYLQAHTRHSNMFIIKRAKVDIVEYPYLNWSWRAREFPEGGDESIKKTCDVVASMNVVLVAVRWKPKTIKYSWSSTLPEGTQTKSPFSKWPARADIIVKRSGKDLAGQWIQEKVNVLDDYLRLYDKEDIDSYEIDAIVLMSDSDNTRTESAADYDNIFFSKN